jgi:hypothetical protein
MSKIFNSTDHNYIIQEIQFSLEELKNLREDRIHNMSMINWWLLKYYNLYKYCRENWNKGSCFGELACSHTMGSELDKFRNFYESLDDVTELHKKEPYLYGQMKVYEEVQHDSLALNKWLLQNEKYGTEDFLIFWIEWLEEDDIVNPNISYFSNVEVKVLAKEFKSTIQFLEIFNDLYWTSEICKSDI